MKQLFIFLTTLAVAFLAISASQVFAACEHTETYGCSNATETACESIGGGGSTRRTRVGEGACLHNNQTCQERFGSGYYCLRIENWNEDCDFCSGEPQATCEDLGGKCVPWCAHTRCTKAVDEGVCPDGEYCCDMACHEEAIRENYCIPYNGACMSVSACAGGYCCTTRRDWPDCDGETTPGICCCDIDSCLDYSCARVGNCVPEESCAPGEEIPPSDPPGKWPDCDITAGRTCCKPGGVTKCQGPDGLGGLCMMRLACVPPNQVAPRPSQGFWDDCFIPGTTIPDPNRDCCIPAKADNSCYQQGGICTKKGDCDGGSPIPRPAGDWVEEECKASNGGVCCGINAGDLNCERNVKDPHREVVACGRFFLVKTKNWSSIYTSSTAAEAAKKGIDFFEPLYNFEGTITIGKKDKDTEGEFTWPIKGDLPRLVGYFPDYKNADGTYNSPPVIKGAKDLANYNFTPGALLLYDPPANTDALAAWLPILYKTYAHYTVPIESCINSRLPGDPGTDKDGNPEMHGAVRYTYGLWKAMHNQETKTGIWDWIARKPGETEKDVKRWAEGLAVGESNLHSLARREEIIPQPRHSEPPRKLGGAKNLLGSFADAQDDDLQQTTTLVSAREAGLVLGANTTNVSCGYPPCERDARPAPEYDEECVWFNGEAVIAGGVENVHITEHNSNPQITYNNDPINPIYTLSYSHTVKVGPIKIDVKEGYLDNYWPLKLNFFMNLIPKAAQEDYILSPPKKVGCKDSCENTWGNMDLYHSGDVKIVSADAADDGGGNLEYLHQSGWAETAEELVMGRQSGGVLGAKTAGAGGGKVLGAAVGGPGYAIPPSWAELYLPIILKDWEE